MKLEKVLDRYLSVHEVYKERRKSYEEVENYLAKLFGQIIHRLRHEEKIERAGIAKQIGVSQSYLSRLENGERPVLAKHFAKLAKLLMFSKEDLGLR